jgi:hypothetical protein
VSQATAENSLDLFRYRIRYHTAKTTAGKMERVAPDAVRVRGGEGDRACQAPAEYNVDCRPEAHEVTL